MILVDTSVIIDFMKGTDNEKAKLFEAILRQGLPYGVASFTFLEVLQGARNDAEYQQLHDYLSTQTIYYIPNANESYAETARLYYDLRRQGITPGSTIDVLIACIAMKNDLYLLHNDNDFDLIASKATDLKTLRQLG